jgi:hypothetical protein
MTLSTLSILLGGAIVLSHIYGVFKPAEFAAALRKFPRSVPVGCVLVGIATLWFILNLRQESIADFETFKPVLYLLFAAVGIGTCIFVQDFLAVRGLAVVLLLLAKLMVDTARWEESNWRLVIVVLAYLWVFAGMWFTISPWRCRDILNWKTANDKRTRIWSMVRVAFGVFVVLLGLAAF